MTISATARLTTLQKSQLDNMNVDSQRAGGIGSRLDAIQYGTLPTVPAAIGTAVGVNAVKYTTTPAIGSAVYVHAAVTLGAAAQDVVPTTQPDVPRLVSVKGNAGGIAGNVVITGTDIAGAAATDTIALSAASEVAGVVAFKTITNINLPAKTNSSGDTVSVGVTNKIGFPVAIPNSSLVISKSFDGTVDAGAITVGATAKLSVYAPAGTLNGLKLLDLVFLV